MARLADRASRGLPHRQVGVAVVGAGRWGRNHVRDLARLPGAELRWVCDLDPRALLDAESLAPSARLTNELRHVLDDPHVEAMVVATDSGRHSGPAQEALLAGKHLLVEKPLALELEQAERLAALAAAQRRLLMVGHLLAYHPAVTRLTGLISAGELGELRYLSAVRTSDSGRREAGGVLFSLGPHDLALVDLLLSATPTSVSARGILGGDGLTEAAFVSLALDDGSLAELRLSWLEPRARRLTVVGSRATAVLDDSSPLEPPLRIHAAANLRRGSHERGLIELGPPRWLPSVPRQAPLTIQCQRFVAAVARGETPATGAEHALRVSRWLAEAGAALDSGLPRTLDVPTRAAAPPLPC